MSRGGVGFERGGGEQAPPRLVPEKVAEVWAREWAILPEVAALTQDQTLPVAPRHDLLRGASSMAAAVSRPMLGIQWL